MAISVAQRANNTQTGFTSSVSTAFGSNNTAANKIIAVVVCADASNTQVTPTDTNNNTYVPVASDVDATNFYSFKVYVVNSCAAGANTVTATNTSFDQIALYVYEVSGLAATASFDKILVSKGDNGLSPTSGGISVTNNNELILGMAVTNASATATYTAGAGYSNLQQGTYVSGLQIAMEEKVISTGGSQAATFTMNANNGNTMTALLSFSDTAIASGSLVNVSDSLATTENIGRTLVDNVTISNSLATSESLDVMRANTRDSSVSDTAVTNEALLLLDSDGLGILNSLALAENLHPEVNSFITTSDNSSLTESLVLLGSDQVNVSDTLTTAENLTELVPTLFITASDSSTISDTNFNFAVTSFVTVSDSLTTSENLSFLESDIDLISDNLATTESLSLTLADNINISNTTSTIESLSFLINPLLLVASDALTTAENPLILIPTLPINVSDGLTLTENYNVFLLAIGTLQLVVSDSLSTAENLALLIPTLYITASDSVATSEAASLVIAYTIIVQDNVATSENLSFLDEDIDLISDNLTTTESLTLLIPELYVSVTDSLTTAENISFSEPEVIVTSDAAAVTESLSLTASPGLKVSNTLTTAENIALQYDINLSRQNTSSIAESLSVANPSAGTVVAVASDALSTDENVSLFIPTLTINTSEALATSEMVSVVGKTAFINVSDSISVLDVASAGSIGIKTSSNITHTEAISIHIQGHIQKTYLYKMSRNNKFLGILQNVTSEFSYAQDINTGGSQCNITVALSADTQDQAVTPLQDELGNTLTDEAGNPLLIERQPDIIGNDNDNILIRNDNDIQIYEFSDYWPNGKLMFSGYISSVQAMFGADDGDIINLTALSDGSEVSEYLIESGTNNDQTQLFQNASDTLMGQNPKSGSYNYDGQTITVGGGVTNISAIVVKLQGSGNPQNVVMSLFLKSQGLVNPDGNHLATTSQTINSSAIADYTFTFISPVAVTAGTQYFFSVTTDSMEGINIFYQNNDIYGSGDMYNANFSGTGSGVFVITPVNNILNNSDLYFKTLTTTNATEAAYTGFDPTDILKDIMLNYNNKGGRITLDPSVQATGLGASYTFNVNSVAEGITKVQELSPNGWYWYIDVATKVLYFQPTATTAQYKFIRGRHLNSLQLKSTIDNLKNVVYFSGGDPGGGNVYVKYTNTASLAAYNNRVGMDRISDSNVLDTTTGLVLAKDDSNEHMSEEYQTQISIIDTTMDITLPSVGDTIGFEGYGSFVDKLVLQITRINYTPDVLTITVGTLPRRVHKDIQKLKDQLIALQVQNNTSSPTTF